jgi:NhaC family Na+:H+ antiporter
LNSHKLPSFWHALVCFGGILVVVVTGVVAFRVSIQVLLMLSIIWASIHTYFLGYKFNEIKEIMSNGISNALGAVYIFILIGLISKLNIAGKNIKN